MSSSISLVRIGDKLDKRSKDDREAYYKLADNLSFRVFNSNLSDDQISEFYINSPSSLSNEEDMTLPPIYRGLGDNERLIMQKILNPQLKLIILKGSLGCGKTTSLKYIVNHIRNFPCDECDNFATCKKKKIIPIINFLEEKYQINNEKEAKKVLYNDLCTSIRGILSASGLLDTKKEFVTFWNKQLDSFKDNLFATPSTMWLAGEIEKHHLETTDIDYNDQIKKRKKVLEKLKKNKEFYFDYLLRLWGFIMDGFYNGKRGCAFIVFDNIDKATLIIQSTLVSLIDDCYNDPGPSFIVTIRPETLERLGLINNASTDNDAKIINVHGDIKNVILDRLERFIHNPDYYFDINDGLSTAEFESIKYFLSKVEGLIKIDKNNNSQYLNFLASACGESYRLALLCAQKIFRISKRDIIDPRFNGYTLIRTSIVDQGESQYFSGSNNPIPNLFQVPGYGIEGYLIKPRILRYLETRSELYAKQGEIRRVLKGFGYEDTSLIRDSITQLLNVYCQLIRSDGFDRYETEREYMNAGNQKITITNIGLGYIRDIVFHLDYLQEIMLDCRLPTKWIENEFGFSTLVEKFLLLSKFLRELVDIDEDETRKFISYYCRSDYINKLWPNLFSYELIRSTYRQIKNVVMSVKAYNPKTNIDAFDDLLNSYKNILLYSEKVNNILLGYYPENSLID